MPSTSDVPPVEQTPGPVLYQMAKGTTALLWSTRILPALALVGGISGLISGIVSTPHETWMVVLNCIVIGLASWILFANRRSLSSIVRRAVSVGPDIEFTRWDGSKVTVPRRGRSLQKDPQRSNRARVVLSPVGEEKPIHLFCQDKGALAMMADLEKRGVVRGPRPPKDVARAALLGGR